MYSYDDIFKNKKKVLFVTAHPDDVDVMWAGTIAKLREDKKEVFVVVVTNGARGSRENIISEEELAKARIQEQTNALKEVGVPKENFATLNYKDGEAENNMELIGKIAYYIRKFKPDLVATQDPESIYHKFENGHAYINHKDHRITGIATVDAVYPFSRDLSFFPEHQKMGVTPHQVEEIMFMGDGNVTIDVTDVIEKKKKALMAHKSQFDEKNVPGMLEFWKKDGKYIEGGTYLNLSWK
jgi:N,N'-diacetylchitobiose non-reducing end deacetylase